MPEQNIMRFEDYWENYGELHASMCGGNIKQFAKEIWMSAIESAHNRYNSLPESPDQQEFLTNRRNDYGSVN